MLSSYGLAELFANTSGLQTDFTGFLRRTGESFDQWSTRLGSNGDVQRFLDYVEAEGPKVAAAGEAVARALGSVVEAAAPLGGPSLLAITGLADAVAEIADSPLGTPLLALAAGITAVSRAQKLLTGIGAVGSRAGSGGLLGGLLGQSAGGSVKAQLDTIKSLPAAYREATAAQAELTKAQETYRTEAASYSGVLQAQNTLTSQGYAVSEKAQSRLADSLGKVELANTGVQTATERVAETEKRRTAITREAAATVGKTAAATAGLAVATSGLADSSGLSQWLDYAQAAELLGVTGRYVSMLAREDLLPFTMAGGQRWYREDHLRMMVAARALEREYLRAP